MDEEDTLYPPISAYPEIKIGSREIDLKTLLHIDPSNLVHDYQTIHHWIATVSYRVSTMTTKITGYKRELTRHEAMFTRKERATHEKRLTEAALKTLITLDPKTQELQTKIDNLESKKSVFVIVLNALENKRDMVINMGAELRKRRKAEDF